MGRTLNVHLIPHSHTDPGWLNTMNDYYGREVKPILSAVMAQLEISHNRTFAWSETCFFARWFAEQSSRRQALVRRLIDDGRFEFVGGGWVQHDEGLPTIGAMLEQMAEGHLWLNETFGVRPSIGWQLDPFGHTASSTALLGRMGMQAVVINRIHFGLKASWRSRRALEYQWRGVAPCLKWGDVLTHVLSNHYSTPKGLDFEGAGDNTRPDSRKADTLRAVALERGDAYRTDQLMILVGDDFRWRKAELMYKAWDKIIADVNSRRAGGRSVHVKWSTPSAYFAAVAVTLQAGAAAVEQPQRAPLLPMYAGDLMPYADNKESFCMHHIDAAAPTLQLSRALLSAPLLACARVSACFDFVTVRALDGDRDRLLCD